VVEEIAFPLSVRDDLMKRTTRGGGWAAIRYMFRMANRVGWRQLWKAMGTKNACKTCAWAWGARPAKQKILENLETYLRVQLPRTPGLDTMACMQAADRGEVHSALCLGGNLFGSNPDAAFAARALGKLELIAYLNTTLNTGHGWGTARQTLILPVLARDEGPQKTTQESMFNFVRLSDGGPVRLQGPRIEVDIIASIAQRVLEESSPVDWQALKEHCSVRQMIPRLSPAMKRSVRSIRRVRSFKLQAAPSTNLAFQRSPARPSSRSTRCRRYELRPGSCG
jgi:hypothetical protein